MLFFHVNLFLSYFGKVKMSQISLSKHFFLLQSLSSHNIVLLLSPPNCNFFCHNIFVTELYFSQKIFCHQFQYFHYCHYLAILNSCKGQFSTNPSDQRINRQRTRLLELLGGTSKICGGSSGNTLHVMCHVSLFNEPAQKPFQSCSPVLSTSWQPVNLLSLPILLIQSCSLLIE